MRVNWWLIEQRQPPTAKDIKQAVKDAKKLPDDGDGDHVLSPFGLEGIPVISHEDWVKSAKQKQVKLKQLKGSTARLTRSNLIWHIQNPGQSRFRGQFNTHVQVVKLKNGDRVIVDGHHRAAALRMLGITKDTVWQLREDDLG